MPLNYASYVDADDSFDEGNRPIEDALFTGNVVTDLVVHDLYQSNQVGVYSGSSGLCAAPSPARWRLGNIFVEEALPSSDHQ